MCIYDRCFIDVHLKNHMIVFKSASLRFSVMYPPACTPWYVICPRVYLCTRIPLFTALYLLYVVISWSDTHDVFFHMENTYLRMALDLLECVVMLLVLHSITFSGYASFLNCLCWIVLIFFPFLFFSINIIPCHQSLWVHFWWAWYGYLYFPTCDKQNDVMVTRSATA